jgi:hypothetical protein
MKLFAFTLALALPVVASAELTEMQRLQKALAKYAGKQPCICLDAPQSTGWLQTEIVANLEAQYVRAWCNIVSFDLQGTKFAESECTNYVVPAK